MFDETNAVKKDGTIKRQTQFPVDTQRWVLSGPHFFVGIPLYKTPRTVCTEKGHYDILHLDALPDDYLPRTNYIPACELSEYQRRIPRVSWKEDGEVEPKNVTEYYRMVTKFQLSQGAERSYFTSIISKSICHINTVVSYAFKSNQNLLSFTGCGISILYDFFIRTTGRLASTGITPALPVLNFDSKFNIRVLSLNCVTGNNRDLWVDCYQTEFSKDCWAKSDSRLPNEFFQQLKADWERNFTLRTDYNRRQAIVEIDVLG